MYTELNPHKLAVEDAVLHSLPSYAVLRHSVFPPCDQCGEPNRFHSFYQTCLHCRREE